MKLKRPTGIGCDDLLSAMNANRLSEIVAVDVRNNIFKAKMDFLDKVNHEIGEAKRRESVASTAEDKQFHKGVHTGMTHIWIMLDKIEI